MDHAQNSPALSVGRVLAGVRRIRIARVGGACDSVLLPAGIKTALERDFTGWQMVTPDQLSSADDRQIWQEAHSNECPGIIAGHFRGRQVEYVLNLVRRNDKSLEQQIVFFEASRQGFKSVVLDPPSPVAL